MLDHAEWEFWIDVGGTFTDCLARKPDGSVITHKLLSSGRYKGNVGSKSTVTTIKWDTRQKYPTNFFSGYTFSIANESATATTVAQFDSASNTLILDSPLDHDPHVGASFELYSGEEAPVTGIRWLMGKSLNDPIGAVSVRLGTTRGTNALLERQGARTAFVTTHGFADILRIAYQNRPRLFDLNIRKSADLYETVVEINERIDATRNVLTPIDKQTVKQQLSALKASGIKSIAVCLLNAYRNDCHEREVEAVATELGFEQVSTSSRLSPLQRIVQRGDTTVVDAYLTPIIRDYVRSIRNKLPAATLKLMTSAGGLVDAESFVGKDSILSGPAGGVVGAAHVAEQAGYRSAIGFDMGGTSTDVSRFDGEFERRYVMEVNDPDSGTGVRIVAPMLAIETVAAGGGSICWFDGQKTVVGPRSAGSDPGPACYGKGGPLCVTDVNLFLGRIPEDRFAFPLDRPAVKQRLIQLCDEINAATGTCYSPEELAVGFATIANANMAAAIKKVSIARGYDVRDDLLVSFGGAGAQHACAIARELGIRTILQHRHAGILSAFGMGVADIKRFAERDVGMIYSANSISSLEPVFAAMDAQLRDELREEQVADDQILPPRRLLDLRYRGQDSVITVPRPFDDNYAAAFVSRHQQLYGFHFPDRDIEIYAARLELTGRTHKPEVAELETPPRVPSANQHRFAYFAGEWRETAVFSRHELAPGDKINGPAIIAESVSTIVVEPGWQAEVTKRDDIVLRDVSESSGRDAIGTEVDAISLELFNNRFASIAEQMGATLQKTSLSTNVKERLDFSCALFTPAGDLVVNAPHIPVHLGAMSETVKSLLRDVSEIHLGDVFVSNDPYRGGSHLPDITVITPVFDDDGELIFFTGSRAHHAEIGGIVPGSMPPFSKTLAEEGVLIRWFRLVESESSSEMKLRDLLANAQYPSRSIDENIADINAQAAANQTGVMLLRQLVAQYGLATVQAFMRHIQAAAAAMMRKALLKIPAGEHRFVDHLDNGSRIDVTITISHDASGGSAIVDFTGTDPVMPSNLNANSAIVRSAVLYCFRCLIEDDIPLNDGVLESVSIHIPENCLLNPPVHDDPNQCAAVVGGNVETSQRVVDVVLGALGVASASQGTMNNVLFGRSANQTGAAFGYYETICGGSGAGPNFNGTDAVHTHMTNTRITDPEVMEDRYPIRVKQFSIRRGSGGGGRHAGGNGIIREIEFLDSLDVSLLTNRRTTQPYGSHGGQPGAAGRNVLFRKGSDSSKPLKPSQHISVNAGDILRIETPGGGGWGETN